MPKSRQVTDRQMLEVIRRSGANGIRQRDLSLALLERTGLGIGRTRVERLLITLADDGLIRKTRRDAATFWVGNAPVDNASEVF